jgi:hypothetical protein
MELIRNKVAIIEREIGDIKINSDSKTLIDNVQVGAFGVSVPIATIKELFKELKNSMQSHEDTIFIGRIVNSLRRFYAAVTSILKTTQATGGGAIEKIRSIVVLSGEALREGLAIIAMEKSPVPIIVKIERDRERGKPRLSDDEILQLRQEISAKFGSSLTTIRQGWHARSIFEDVDGYFRRVCFSVRAENNSLAFTLAEPVRAFSDLRFPMEFRNYGVEFLLTMTLFSYVENFVHFANDVLTRILSEHESEIDLAHYKGVISVRPALELLPIEDH